MTMRKPPGRMVRAAFQSRLQVHCRLDDQGPDWLVVQLARDTLVNVVIRVDNEHFVIGSRGNASELSKELTGCELVERVSEAPVDKHADIDDLVVPDERRPSMRAPILKLFGYLIRALLRKWAERLEKAKS